jgi:PAS domain S-box-containing protein
MEAELRKAHNFLEVKIQERTSELSIANAALQAEIAERQEIEMKLRNSEEQFRRLFENSLDGILFSAPDGRILAANPAASRILGATQQEICAIGRNIVVDVTDPRLQPALEERLQTGSFQGELYCIRKDAGPFPAELSSALFRLGNGDLRACIISWQALSA